MTKIFNSLGEFAAHVATVQADIRAAEEAAVVKGCKIVQRTAKGMIGHEQPFWQGLKPETIARKARGNTPLLETGELRASIEMSAPHREVDEVVGYVGSNNEKAVFHELGTSKVPARPFLATAAAGKEREIHEMTGRLIFGALVHGGANYRAFRKVAGYLHRAGENVKEAFDDNDDEAKRRR